MGRTVVYIIGARYSGSSLLNLLLDSQPRVRGLGEAVHLVSGWDGAQCALYARPVRECPAQAAVDRNRFYGSLFAFYGDCDVLIDSSKSVAECLGTHPFEPDLEPRVILLSKAPHEFAYSWIGHREGRTPEAAIQFYLDYYREQISLLSRLNWFWPWQCVRVTYRHLATRTEATLGRLCDFFGVPSDATRPSWATDTHVIGGNWMVAAQMRGQQCLFTDADWYLNGKYSGKYHRIFYDNQWRSDRGFVKRCIEIYRHRRDEIREMLDDLGQLDFRQQMEALGAIP